MARSVHYCSLVAYQNKSTTQLANPINKPDRATMRPDCVPTWSEIRADCVRQMDEQTEQIDKLLEYLT